jgi:hypothetical protein
VDHLRPFDVGQDFTDARPIDLTNAAVFTLSRQGHLTFKAKPNPVIGVDLGSLFCLFQDGFNVRLHDKSVEVDRVSRGAVNSEADKPALKNQMVPEIFISDQTDHESFNQKRGFQVSVGNIELVGKVA